MVTASEPARLKGRRYPQYELQYHSNRSLRFYDGRLQEIRRLERIEISARTMTARFVSPDEVLIVSQYGTNAHPYYYNLRSGEFRTIADRAGTFASVVPTNNSREIVFSYSSYTDPADLYRMRWDGTAFARVTWFNEEVRRLSQTRQYPVSFTLRNGRRFDGVLILPASVAFPPKNVPIVAWQAGGPVATMQNTWAAALEAPYALLPNFGIGVLVVPLYGRIGVGPDRFESLADSSNLGQIDIDAHAEIVRQLRARGWASKVGITGCSYGGYFTTQSITRHPTTYDAAHTMCSLIDWIVEWNRGFDSLSPWLMGLPPYAALEEYRRDSPAYNADRVRTPLLAFHGTKDYIPITVMENFMLQVINNGVPAKLLKFQDAGHGFLRTTPPELSSAYELYGAQEQILWFRQHLGQ
jgi:dipeptidyl aminopeptidase/acylaminoacyl peptidase